MSRQESSIAAPKDIELTVFPEEEFITVADAKRDPSMDDIPLNTPGGAPAFAGDLATVGDQQLTEQERILQEWTGKNNLSWKNRAASAVAAAGLLWGFMLSLKILGTGMKILGGRDSAKMFDFVDNPFSGVMVGILATVLLQSSSTSTSLFIAAVGAGEMSVQNAISAIMGANIGTTVTNTLVALFSAKGDKASVTRVAMPAPADSKESAESAQAPHLPTGQQPIGWLKRAGLCCKRGSKMTESQQAERRRSFSCATIHDLFNIGTVTVLLPFQWGFDFLGELTAWMIGNPKPCEGTCEPWKNPLTEKIIDDVAKYIAQADKKVLKAIAKNDCSGADSICDNPLLKGGWLKELGASDTTAGLVCTIGSVVILYFCLYFLVKNLKNVLKGGLAKGLKKALSFHPLVTMLIGTGITVAVQSSSVTTSAMMPLCAGGIVSLEEMFPLTLGANMGTTVTGLLAAYAATSHPKQALQVALAHVAFNVIGTLLAYPIKPVRKKLLDGARGLGNMAAKHRLFPAAYAVGTFIAAPAIGLGVAYGISSA
ncbi:MAG: Na/Pi symporter [Coxiellaceae bacterium]|nr:Na/Pi symporter [Coxiellaceae bacterium]